MSFKDILTSKAVKGAVEAATSAARSAAKSAVDRTQELLSAQELIKGNQDMQASEAASEIPSGPASSIQAESSPKKKNDQENVVHSSGHSYRRAAPASQPRLITQADVDRWRQLDAWYTQTGQHLASDNERLRKHVEQLNQTVTRARNGTEANALQRQLNEALQDVATLMGQLQSQQRSLSTVSEAEMQRVGAAFLSWCREGTPIINRVRRFEIFLESRSLKADVRLARRAGDVYELTAPEDLSDAPAYWIVECADSTYLLPQPASRTSFLELQGFSADPEVTPGNLAACLPARVVQSAKRWQVEERGTLLC